MATNTGDDPEPQAPDPLPAETPIEKMLGALDELLAAAKRVVVEGRTTGERVADDSPLKDGSTKES